MRCEDGDEITIVRRVSEHAILEHAEELTQSLTGWPSFGAMCKANPTIRPVDEAHRLLRKYFQMATGKLPAA